MALVCVLVVSFTFIQCGGSDPKPVPTEKERVTALLTSNGGKWSPSSSGITVDGVDVTQDLFKDFSITFSANTFTTTGTTPVWLRNDTWSFKDETATVFIRGQDGKEVTINSISETQLKMTLEWDQTTTAEDGRKRSLQGTHEFILNK